MRLLITFLSLISLANAQEEIARLVEQSKEQAKLYNIPAKQMLKACHAQPLSEQDKELFSQHLKQAEAKNSPLQGKGELIACVTLSMGEASLKDLDADMRKVGGRLVVRGLVNDSFKDTQTKILKLGIQVDIDPELFTKHDIKVAPTILLVDEKKVDLVAGNISLKAALEIISNKGELKKQAKVALKKLEGK